MRNLMLVDAAICAILHFSDGCGVEISRTVRLVGLFACHQPNTVEGGLPEINTAIWNRIVRSPSPVESPEDSPRYHTVTVSQSIRRKPPKPGQVF